MNEFGVGASPVEERFGLKNFVGGIQTALVFWNCQGGFIKPKVETDGIGDLRFDTSGILSTGV